MNKVTTFVLTAALVLSTGLAFAQDTGMKKDDMMERSVVPTSDEGYG